MRVLLSRLSVNAGFNGLLLFNAFLLIRSFGSVQGNVQVCHSVIPPIQGLEYENCTMVCSLKFQHAVSAITSDELTLCVKNSTVAVFCANHADCRQYHIGAYCKMIPCLCTAKTGPPGSFIFDPSFKVPRLSTCVVSAKYVNPDLPIVPFPWKTLLIVCAIVFAFATCLICLRWLSPIIRSMQAKRNSRGNRERPTATQEEANLFVPANQQSDSTPFTYYIPQGLPRIYRANPRRSQRSRRASSRARYATCSQAEASLSRTQANQDKPPPYETAIQLPPPTYEDVERAINESQNQSADNSTQTNNQRVEGNARLESVAEHPDSLPT
ncbi:uncharacterized protein LOC129220086 [Uloborus diversus]|uniref:uncharacterized protein LOC129220086 n=1 Tax=Uloborus diversus TaxID=327109 RepID=UPI002409610F|nr:uncharacterized protein LOC129220086 [Uloborus diversus]